MINICYIYIWSKMSSSSLDTLIKVCKTTSPQKQKLFDYNCVTLLLSPDLFVGVGNVFQRDLREGEERSPIPRQRRGVLHRLHITDRQRPIKSKKNHPFLFLLHRCIKILHFSIPFLMLEFT